jgi:Zn-dependent peptidase ImmA (M78 family)/DNA-binding transcriptional regulator YiaG
MASLTAIFGPEAEGHSEKDSARHSSRQFVRSEGQLAVYDSARRPTGHVYTAWEAYSAYGIDTLEEAVEFGAAILRCQEDASATALKTRRESLNLSRRDVADATSLSEQVVSSAEKSPSDVPIVQQQSAAFVLGLDERLLSYVPNSGGDSRLAYRLRDLSQKRPQSTWQMKPRTALRFAEAASIIRVQMRLQDWLGIETERHLFSTDSSYGTYQTPTWKIGYNLADEARIKLGLGASPILSMRELTEHRLGIPVVQVDLDQQIAGATIVTHDDENREVRGILLNSAGENENVWVRRTTLAHELGHLLFDPNERLQNVRVDSYEQSESDPEVQDLDRQELDKVEQRANAFAIAFLAPLDEVRSVAPIPFSKSSIVDVMQKFGLSQTAARYHVFNAHFRQHEIPQFAIHETPSDELRAAENFTTDFFPLQSTPVQRRGKFADLVARAYTEGCISPETASFYLHCSKEEFSKKVGALRQVFDHDNA